MFFRKQERIEELSGYLRSEREEHSRLNLLIVGLQDANAELEKRSLEKTLEMQDAKREFDAALRQNTANWRSDCQDLQMRLDQLAHRVEFRVGDVVRSPVHGLCTLTFKGVAAWDATIRIEGIDVTVKLPFDTFTHSFVS